MAYTVTIKYINSGLLLTSADTNFNNAAIDTGCLKKNI